MREGNKVLTSGKQDILLTSYVGGMTPSKATFTHFRNGNNLYPRTEKGTLFCLCKDRM